jgi:hypothetical protein
MFNEVFDYQSLSHRKIVINPHGFAHLTEPIQMPFLDFKRCFLNSHYLKLRHRLFSKNKFSGKLYYTRELQAADSSGGRLTWLAS